MRATLARAFAVTGTGEGTGRPLVPPSDSRSTKRRAPHRSRLTLAVAAALGAALLAPFATPAGAVIHPRSTPTYATVYQGYGPTDVVSVTCPTTQVCLAVGEQPQYSMLYRSTDGGATWAPMAVPGGSLDPDYVYQDQSVAISCGAPTFCVLEYATNLGDAPVDQFEVSSDGGLTWKGQGSIQLQSYDPEAGLADLTCIGFGTCLGILGGQIASTTDGGGSWVTHNRSVGTAGLACLSERLCYVVQTTATRGTDALVVSSTNNRGGTLVPLLRSTGTGWSAAAVISCASARVCTVLKSGSSPQLESTTDGGRTWHARLAPQLPPLRAQTLLCTTAQDCTLLASDLASPSRIESFSTADGGSNWLPASVGQLGFPKAKPSLWCSAIASGCLAALGTRSVFRIDNVQLGSAAWSASAASISAPPLEVVACQQGGGCLALGSGVKATSKDDGHTWTVAADPALDGDVITSLTCPLPSTCVASGHSGPLGAPSGLVLLTTDLGNHWTTATLPWEVGYVGGMECASADTCLALPGFASSLTHAPTFLLRSTDGGLDWSLVEIASSSAHLSLSAVQCPTASHCIAVGAALASALVEVSDDAGATWSTVDASAGGFGGDTPFEGLACTSSLDCETSAVSASGSDVDAYGTTDGGLTWSKLGLMFSVPQAGYWGASPSLASCSNGTCVAFSVNVVGPERPNYYVSLLASADGGVTWDAFEPPYEPAGVSIALAPDGTVIAVGENAEAGPLLVVGTA